MPKKTKTYGLSTLRTKHVDHVDGDLMFQFIGKKNKEHNVTVHDQKLVDLVNQCEEIPGWELFQYYDDDGNKQSIDSGLINEYIQRISGELFTAKDFRTWSASKIFFESLRDLGHTEDEKENKTNRLQAYDEVANSLGNTRSVCREYYVHPKLNSAYEDGTIVPYFENVEEKNQSSNDYLSQTEEVLLDMIADYELNLELD